MSNIRRTRNYPQVIASLVAQHRAIGDNTLVVTQKKLEQGLRDIILSMGPTGVELAYFGNTVGKNDWRDFNVVWIVATPNVRYEVYPIRWSIATGKSLAHKELRMTAGKGEERRGRLSFRNTEFEDLRFHDVLKEIYQAIKRINRDNSKTAKVYVVTADDRYIMALKRLLKGIKLGEPIIPDVEYRSSTTKGNLAQHERLAGYILSLAPGTYPKRDVYTALSIDKSNFSRLLRHERILRLINSGEIRISNRAIERL